MCKRETQDVHVVQFFKMTNAMRSTFDYNLEDTQLMQPLCFILQHFDYKCINYSYLLKVHFGEEQMHKY